MKMSDLNLLHRIDNSVDRSTIGFFLKLPFFFFFFSLLLLLSSKELNSSNDTSGQKCVGLIFYSKFTQNPECMVVRYTTKLARTIGILEYT